MFTTLYIKFSDMQGQIAMVFVVVSGRNSNSSKLLCMSSLPARMRLIKSKMKELECSQDFSHYKSMGDILVTYQYEEDPIKNRGARVFTTLYNNFSDAHNR